MDVRLRPCGSLSLTGVFCLGRFTDMAIVWVSAMVIAKMGIAGVGKYHGYS